MKRGRNSFFSNSCRRLRPNIVPPAAPYGKRVQSTASSDSPKAKVARTFLSAIFRFPGGLQGVYRPATRVTHVRGHRWRFYHGWPDPKQGVGMPWMESSTMSLKMEFVMLAQSEEANVRQLCRRFGISAKTGYKWLERFAAGGAAALIDRSRRPHHSPFATKSQLQERVCQMRSQHPAWGGRKIHARLSALGSSEEIGR